MSVEAITQPLVYAPNPPIPPITLTVERIGETSTTQVAPFSKTITDANVAFMLDNALARYSTYGGSSAPPPASACPPNDGVLYRLTFYQAGVRFAVKDIEATGCQLIFTHDGLPPEHVSESAFWRLLAQALDVPLASLGVGPTMA